MTTTALLTLLALCSPAAAQTTRRTVMENLAASSSTIIISTPTKRVGIGFVDPQHNLSVQSVIGVASTAGNDRLLLTGSETKNTITNSGSVPLSIDMGAGGVLLQESGGITFAGGRTAIGTTSLTPCASCHLMVFGNIVSTANISGNSFLGAYAVSVRYWGARGDGTTDDTNALKAAIAANVPLYYPQGSYPINDSLFLTQKNGVYWYGHGTKSIIINRAPAGHPTLIFQGTLYYDINGVSISGRAGFPNDAIWLSSTAATPGSSFGTFQNFAMEPNGNGIEIKQANTVNILNVKYWSSDGTGMGSTADSGVNGTRRAAIYFSSSTPSGFANEITIRDCNLTGIDPAVAYAAAIDMKKDALVNMQNIVIQTNELELSTGTAIDIDFGVSIHIVDNFMESSIVTIKNSRYVTLNGNYNPKSVNFISNVQAVARDMVMGFEESTFTVAGACFQCGAENSFFQHIIDSATNSYFHNVRTSANDWPSGIYPDKIPNTVWISTLSVFGTSTFDGTTRIGLTGTPLVQISTKSYTPTLTNTTNIGASTALALQCVRTDKVMACSGRVAIDATAAGAFVLGMSLPTASDFVDSTDAGGTMVSTDGTVNLAGGLADTTNDRIIWNGNASSTANISYGLSFQYTIK